MHPGYSGKRLGADNICAVKDIPRSTLWSMGCVKIPLFGDVVKIQTTSSILALCEVEAYAEPYGKIKKIEMGRYNYGLFRLKTAMSWKVIWWPWDGRDSCVTRLIKK